MLTIESKALVKMGNRAYVEMSAETNLETFGNDGEAVSGFVVASDHATAEAVYTGQVRSLYAGKLVRNERLAKSTQLQQSGTTLKIPPNNRLPQASLRSAFIHRTCNPALLASFS